MGDRKGGVKGRGSGSGSGSGNRTGSRNYEAGDVRMQRSVILVVMGNH